MIAMAQRGALAMRASKNRKLVRLPNQPEKNLAQPVSIRPIPSEPKAINPSVEPEPIKDLVPHIPPAKTIKSVDSSDPHRLQMANHVPSNLTPETARGVWECITGGGFELKAYEQIEKAAFKTCFDAWTAPLPTAKRVSK